MQAIPGLLGLGGAGLSAYAQAAPASRTGTSTTTPIEPGYQSQFRQSLLPQFNSLLAKAGQPVYGDAQRSSFMGNLNTLANSATNNLANTLSSRTGSLNSGAFSSGAANIAMGRLGQMANYDAMVPAANQQAMLNNTSQVLGMGLNFVGRAPIGSTTVSNEQATNGNFLSNLAGNLGNLAAAGKPGSKTGTNPFNYLPGGRPSDPLGNVIQELPVGPSGLPQDLYGPVSYDGGTPNTSTVFNPGNEYDPIGNLPVGPSGLDSSSLNPPLQSYDPYNIYNGYGLNSGNPSDPNDNYYNPYEMYKG